MKVMKKLLLFTVSLALVFALISTQYVLGYDNWGTDITTAAGATTTNGAITSTQTIAQSIITITRVITLGVAITMLVVLAMKYMMAAPGDKATIKKSAVTYVVGAIVMFASYGILTIIQQFAGAIEADGSSGGSDT